MNECINAWTTESVKITKLAEEAMPEFMKGRYSSDHWDMPHTIDIIKELIKRIDKAAPDTKWPGHQFK